MIITTSVAGKGSGVGHTYASDNATERKTMAPVATARVLPFVPRQPETIPPIVLQTFTYDDRRTVLPALIAALDHTGCWLLERKPLSLTHMEFRFETQLRGALELYSALIGSGLEMTRGTHLALTGLCTLGKHSRRATDAARVVEVKLEVSFLEDLHLASALMPGAGAA